MEEEGKKRERDIYIEARIGGVGMRRAIMEKMVFSKGNAGVDLTVSFFFIL